MLANRAMVLNNKNIILGVTASIAAYKAVYLLRLLKKSGANVRVVSSPAVSHFIGELSWGSLSGEQVFSGLWSENWSEHVALGTWADLMIVAPATANTMAKFANGLCDNALTAVYLAARCPVLIAPAMDADMYLHPSLNRNIQQLTTDGVQVLPTTVGFLASGLEGPGRMMEPDEILRAAEGYFDSKPLSGKKMMITAGPTREAIDPVRYISNHSSGKMGYAIAETAASMGAEVSLISGPTALADPPHLQIKRVVSSKDMFEAVQRIAAEQDILIMSAAVSDYSPTTMADQKIKKSEEEMSISLKKTKDILKYLGQKKQEGQLLVGFALETNDEISHAKTKLEKKNLDFIVLNSLRDKGAGFAHDTNKITILDRWGNIQAYELKSKKEVAKDIMNKIVDILQIANNKIVEA